MLDLRLIAQALGGDVVGGQVNAPGPGHSRRDRSMSVKLSASAPDGFLVHSHAGDDFAACRDHVRRALGMSWAPDSREYKTRPAVAPPQVPDDDRPTRIAQALAVWKASAEPRGTVAERYFATRKLELGEDLAGTVIRWNASLRAMVALFRNIQTGEPQALSRTYLSPDGKKLDRKFLGPVGGAAVMLDDFDGVTSGLHIAEGIETAMSARQLGLRPCWALGSAGSVAAFPVLGGIECLTLLAEHDPASAQAVEACGERWHAAGRIVLVNQPLKGKDLNDCIRGVAA